MRGNKKGLTLSDSRSPSTPFSPRAHFDQISKFYVAPLPGLIGGEYLSPGPPDIPVLSKDMGLCERFFYTRKCLDVMPYIRK